MQRLVMWVLSLAAAVNSLNLPNYIKPCAMNDPEFNDCARRHGMEAIPHFINGDPKYRVPPLEPMLISELVVKEGTKSVGMTLIARNATLSGLKDVNITATRHDFEKRHIEYDWYFPRLTMDCVYNVTGRVLLLPVVGHGQGTFVLKDTPATFSYDYDLVKKKNKLYLVPRENSKLKFEPRGMTLHLDNLFNGDKFLGDNMNRFLNENWEELMRDIGPALAEAMSTFIRQVLTNIFLLVPFNEAIPDQL